MRTILHGLGVMLFLLTLSMQSSVRPDFTTPFAITSTAFTQVNKIPLDGYTIIEQAYQDNSAKMALDGDILAIGFPGQKGEGGVFSSGVVVVFERNQGGAGNWGVSKVIPNPNNVSMDYFGKDIVLQGTTLAVGMPGYDPGVTDVGSVYIYERNQGGAGNWGLRQTILKDNIVGTDWAFQLGYSLALEGDRLAVSAPYRPSHGYPGRVYFYERDPEGDGTWSFAEMVADESGSSDFGFGINIALQNDILAVGAPRTNWNQGSVQLFQHGLVTPDNWSYVTTVTGNEDYSGFFGQELALQGNTLAVGAPGFQHRFGDIAISYGGAAYIFERNQGGSNQWGLVKQFMDEEREFVDIYLGFAIGLQDDLLLVGYPFKDVLTSSSDTLQRNRGSLYLYDRSTSNPYQWGPTTPLLNGDGDADDYFGVALAIDGKTLAVIGQGSVYIYERQILYNSYLPLIKG